MDRQPLLGALEDTEDGPSVRMSRLGMEIVKNEIEKIELQYPMIVVWKVCVMPDHLHIIINVKNDLPQGITLGVVVRGFKTGCSKAWWRLCNSPCVETQGTQFNCILPIGSELPASVSTEDSACIKRLPLFEPGYNDRIISRFGQLNRWSNYLDENPRRLHIKRKYPDLFTVLGNIEISGRNCQIVGNRFLLDIPDKVAVIIHHHYTIEECNKLCAHWLSVGENGGVLVGTAVAPLEKRVLREAMRRGYNIILLRENGFPPLYKPAGESFYACSRGQLLQISPFPYCSERKKITRQQCLFLNELAEAIATGSKQ